MGQIIVPSFADQRGSPLILAEWSPPRPSGVALALPDLPERVLLDELSLAERIEIAAAHLDAFVRRGGAAQGPLRYAGVAGNEMGIIAVLDVGNAGKARAETLANCRKADESRAPGIGAARHL